MPPEPLLDDMQFDVEAAAMTLTLQGVVSVQEAVQLQAEMLEIDPSVRRVIVDCSQAEKLHCAAFQVLLSLNNSLHKRGGEMQIRGVNDAILQFARTAGLDGLVAPH